MKLSFAFFLFTSVLGAAVSGGSPVPTSVQFVSKLPGIVIDGCQFGTKLTLGGGTCANNGAVINAFLSTASKSHPVKLIFDFFTLTSGVQIVPSGYTEIEGISGGGFTVPSNCDCELISNTAGGPAYQFPQNTSTVPSISTNANVYIHGMSLNGNRGTYVSPNSSSNGNVSGTLAGEIVGGSWGYDSPYLWMKGIDLQTLYNVRIEDNYFYDVAAYNISVTNVTYFWALNNRIEAPTFDSFHYQDGVHLSGNVFKSVISGNNFLSLGDDSVAINAPEGFYGNIGDVLVSNNHFQNVLSCVRAYGSSSGPYTIGHVLISGNACNTNTNGYGYYIGEDNTSAGADYIASWKSVNNVFTSPVVSKMSNSGVRDLSFTGDTWFPTQAGAFAVFAAADSLSSVSFSNVTIYRTSNINAYFLQMSHSATIKKLSFFGATVNDPPGSSYTAVPSLVSITSGTISELNALLVNWTNITALTDTFTGLTSYTAPNSPPVTIASLPTCASATKGNSLAVSNATTPTYNGTLTAGGSVIVPVFCDGSAWRSH